MSTKQALTFSPFQKKKTNFFSLFLIFFKIQLYFSTFSPKTFQQKAKYLLQINTKNQHIYIYIYDKTKNQDLILANMFQREKVEDNGLEERQVEPLSTKIERNTAKWHESQT